MAFSSFFSVFAILAVSVHACDIHKNYLSHPHLGRRQNLRRAEGREELDWEYSRSFDWHTIRPGKLTVPNTKQHVLTTTEYATCQSGTNQSPINLISSQGLATTHQPDFSGYAAHPEVAGNFFNWGFGPAYTLHHEGEDFSTLPAMKFDDQTLFLSGWHIHLPSEHLVDGVRSRAELHMVHVDAAGEAKSVVGIRIDPSQDPNVKSAFMDSLPELIHFNDTAEMEGVMTYPMAQIEEVSSVKEYWTYRGSLTTPPCSEGLRWFVPKDSLKVSVEQMVKLLGASRFSHRVEQTVLLHQINV